MITAVKILDGAVRAYEYDEAALQALEDQGILDAIVEEMQRLCPKNTGAGAASIDFEKDPSGDFWRVSWGKEHFYLYFSEVGTVNMVARPFARPTADKFNHGG